MGIRRIQGVVVLFALSCLPASAQSLGDVARAERERRSKIAHHAPVLTNEDLRHDKILEKIPIEPNAASHPSDNGTDDATGENVSLGDYARALRQRRRAQEAAASTAAHPAQESRSADSNPVTLTPLSGMVQPGQKTISVGEFARQVRAERDAARLARTRNSPPQSMDHATTNASRVPLAPSLPEVDRGTPTQAASPIRARSSELRVQPSAPDWRVRQPRAVLEPGAMANGESIRVPRGSSLWRLAREHLGAGRLWSVLWKANPQIRDPNRIQAGQLLRCPVLRDPEQVGSSRSAGLGQPSSAGVSLAGSAKGGSPLTNHNRSHAARFVPTASGILPSEQTRKVLSSRALSR
jgi:nucleoid-associated protein YgaU